MNMYEQITEPTVGTAAIGRSLAVMSIVEFACDSVPAITDPRSLSHDGDIAYRLSVATDMHETWRNHHLYDALQAQKIGRLIVGGKTPSEAVLPKLDIIDEALAAAKEPISSQADWEEIQGYVTRMARYDALKRIGLLNREADDLSPAVRAAYDFKATDSTLVLGEVTCKRNAEIERAHRIYTSRLFTTMVEPGPYEAIQHSENPSARAWWDQLSHDLQVFDARTI